MNGTFSLDFQQSICVSRPREVLLRPTLLQTEVKHPEASSVLQYIVTFIMLSFTRPLVPKLLLTLYKTFGSRDNWTNQWTHLIRNRFKTWVQRAGLVHSCDSPAASVPLQVLSKIHITNCKVHKFSFWLCRSCCRSLLLLSLNIQPFLSSVH